MSSRLDSNVLFSRHLTEMRAYLQLDGFALHLVQRSLLTEREVIYLHSLEGGDLQCCHLVRLLKKRRNAFESFVEALDEEVASDYSANTHGHRQLLENMRGSLATLQNQSPRSRSNSFLSASAETDSPARSPSPLSSVSYNSRQSQSSSVSLDLSPSLRSEHSDSITTGDSLKALGELAQKVLSENWELREALEHKSSECEELRQELNMLQQSMKRPPTKIPEPCKVPLVHNRRSYHEAVSEGCLCAMDHTQVLSDKGIQRSVASSAPSLRAASRCTGKERPLHS